MIQNPFVPRLKRSAHIHTCAHSTPPTQPHRYSLSHAQPRTTSPSPCVQACAHAPNAKPRHATMPCATCFATCLATPNHATPLRLNAQSQGGVCAGSSHSRDTGLQLELPPWRCGRYAYACTARTHRVWGAVGAQPRRFGRCSCAFKPQSLSHSAVHLKRWPLRVPAAHCTAAPRGAEANTQGQLRQEQTPPSRLHACAWDCMRVLKIASVCFGLHTACV